MISTVILENALTHPPKVCTGVQVTNVIAWMAARKFPLENHAVGIIGIMVHDPIYVGSRLLGAGDSFGEVKYRALSWTATSMAVSTISSLPFEIAPIMPL